jgi:aryl-alcohol dehydrogenase-like predicted oxidoreductase
MTRIYVTPGVGETEEGCPGGRPRAVIYNAFHQAPEEHLLPACAEHGVGVIVRVALDEGGLTGRITPDTTFPDGDFRNSFFGGDRWAQRRAAGRRGQAPLGAELLRVPTAPPAVAGAGAGAG